VAEYLEALRPQRGLLLLDDTQALGILGTRDGSCPYGSGGGGSLRWNGVRCDNIILISSLAKAFGAPIAALCASEATVRWFRDASSTRVHCSPPSAAALHAAANALRWNRAQGDSERRRLHRLVREFRAQASLGGLACRGGDFPVQTPVLPSGIDVPLLHGELQRRGVRAVLHRSRVSDGAALSFLITSGHGIADIRHAVGMLHACLRHAGFARRRRESAHGTRVHNGRT
jgi:8-amino-7-oxononanoate synthase